MGQTPGEIETEIDYLRRETELIVKELERRAGVQNVLREAGTAVTNAARSAAAVSMATAPILGGVASSVGLALVLFAISTVVLGRNGAAAEMDLEMAKRRRRRLSV